MDLLTQFFKRLAINLSILDFKQKRDNQQKAKEYPINLSILDFKRIIRIVLNYGRIL